MLALAIGIVVAWRAGIVRGKREAEAAGRAPLLPAAMLAPPAPAPEPPAATTGTPSTTVDAARVPNRRGWYAASKARTPRCAARPRPRPRKPSQVSVCGGTPPAARRVRARARGDRALPRYRRRPGEQRAAAAARRPQHARRPQAHRRRRSGARTHAAPARRHDVPADRALERTRHRRVRREAARVSRPHPPRCAGSRRPARCTSPSSAKPSRCATADGRIPGIAASARARVRADRHPDASCGAATGPCSSLASPNWRRSRFAR